MNEADTCRKQVVPLLQAAGWDDEPHSIAEQRTITDGRIIPKEDIAHLPPEQIAASILEKEQRIADIMGRIQKLLARRADS
jgi:type I site-specific restriction endonuclease